MHKLYEQVRMQRLAAPTANRTAPQTYTTPIHPHTYTPTPQKHTHTHTHTHHHHHPKNTHTQFRKRAVVALPRLRYLDRPIFELERLAAEAWAQVRRVTDSIHPCMHVYGALVPSMYACMQACLPCAVRV